MSAPFVPLDLHRVARVLDGLGHEIEMLGHQLCADPALVAAHMEQLQAIDRIAQYQRALASILRADCMKASAVQAGLDELCNKLLEP